MRHAHIRWVMMLIALTGLDLSAASQVGYFGVSADDVAWVGAATARTHPSSAAALQPANISFLEVPTFVLSLHGSVDQLSVDFDQVGQREVAENYIGQGMMLGGAIPIGGPFRRKVAFGFTLFNPMTHFSRINIHDPARPFWLRYDGSADRLELFLGIGVSITDWLRIGIGSQTASTQYGATLIEQDAIGGRYTNQEATATLKTGLRPQASVAIEAMKMERAEISVSGRWRSSTQTESQLINIIDLTGFDTGFFLPSLVQTNFTPTLYELSLTLDLVPSAANIDPDSKAKIFPFGFMVSLQYEEWSQMNTPFIQLESRIRSDLLGNLGLGEALNTPRSGQDRAVDVGFQDTVSFKTGLVFRSLNGAHVWKSGYGFRPTPVPKQTGSTSILDGDAHLIGLGYQYQFDWPWLGTGPLEIGCAYQGHIQVVRDVEKASGFDVTGNYRTSGAVHRGVLSLGFNFD